jgi:hypothetical protein
MHFRDVRVSPECVVSRPIGEKKKTIIILFFSLLVSEGVIIDSRTDPRSRISLPRLIIIFIINQGQ